MTRRSSFPPPPPPPPAPPPACLLRQPLSNTPPRPGPGRGRRHPPPPFPVEGRGQTLEGPAARLQLRPPRRHQLPHRRVPLHRPRGPRCDVPGLVGVVA